MLKNIISIFRKKHNQKVNKIAFSSISGKLSVDIALNSYSQEDLDEMVNILSIFLTEYGMSDTLTIMRGEFNKDGREEEFKYLAQQLSVLSQSILALQENKDEITERKPCISPSEMI